MAEETKAPAAAPAPAPAQAPNANVTIQRNAATAAAELAERQSNPAAPGNFRPAVGAAPTAKHPARSPLITNPEPAKVEEEEAPSNLPASTIAEMAAGRAALEKNKPVAEALEDARRRRADGETQVATNPVDNVTRTAEVAPKV